MQTMTVRQLIEALEEFVIEHGEETYDMPVRFAHQPNYPLAAVIDPEIRIATGRVDTWSGREAKMVYLREAGDASNDYAPRGVYGAPEGTDGDEICGSCGKEMDAQATDDESTICTTCRARMRG